MTKSSRGSSNRNLVCVLSLPCGANSLFPRLPARSTLKLIGETGYFSICHHPPFPPGLHMHRPYKWSMCKAPHGLPWGNCTRQRMVIWLTKVSLFCHGYNRHLDDTMTIHSGADWMMGTTHRHDLIKRSNSSNNC